MAASAPMARKLPDSLFAMLSLVYQLYMDDLNQKGPTEHIALLEGWCQRMKAMGFPGWGLRLTPYLDRIKDSGENAVEALCDAIPYH